MLGNFKASAANSEMYTAPVSPRNRVDGYRDRGDDLRSLEIENLFLTELLVQSRRQNAELIRELDRLEELLNAALSETK
jgi:hypothetical protein